MKTRLRLFGGGVVLGALALLVALIAPAKAVIYNSFPSSDPNLQLNGTATLTSGVLRLTSGAESQDGSAFLKATQPTTSSFESRFQATLTGTSSPDCISPDTEGDGITFTLQHSGAGAGALGNGGGSLGYGGITPSLAVELDIFKNQSGPNDQGSGNHLAIDTNGALNDLNLTDPGFTIGDGQTHTYWVDYDATSHTVRVFAAAAGLIKPSTPLITFSDDLSTRLGSSMFAGFTGATGACTAIQDVNNWLFCNTVDNPSGSVIVPSGATYCITGNVPGNVLVSSGGQAVIRGATINGNVTSTGGSGFQMCNSIVKGSVTVTNNTGFVLVGDGGEDVCNPNSMSSLTLNNNTAGFEASGNTVNGNMSVNNNTVAAGSTDETGIPASNIVEGNHVSGTLSCTGNTPTPIDEGTANPSPTKTGQCASL